MTIKTHCERLVRKDEGFFCHFTYDRLVFLYPLQLANIILTTSFCNYILEEIGFGIYTRSSKGVVSFY